MILCIGTTPAAQRVMVFGNLKIDAVNRAVTTLDGAAGKSINVAKVLHALGEHPVATGFLGGDRGKFLKALLEARGLETEFISVSAPTRQCITIIDESAGTITELVEESQPVDAVQYDQLLDIVKRRITGCRAVIMSGTVASGGPPDLYLQIARVAQAAGALRIADAAGAVLREVLKANPGLVKPNRFELEATVGHALLDEGAVIDAMRDLHGRGAQRVVVTNGSHPALAFDGDVLLRLKGPKLKAVNPIGSGDAFTAGWVWGWYRHSSFVEACRCASAVGAANALTLMAGEIDRADVDRLVHEVQIEEL